MSCFYEEFKRSWICTNTTLCILVLFGYYWIPTQVPSAESVHKELLTCQCADDSADSLSLSKEPDWELESTFWVTRQTNSCFLVIFWQKKSYIWSIYMRLKLIRLYSFALTRIFRLVCWLSFHTYWYEIHEGEEFFCCSIGEDCWGSAKKQ